MDSFHKSTHLLTSSVPFHNFIADNKWTFFSADGLDHTLYNKIIALGPFSTATLNRRAEKKRLS